MNVFDIITEQDPAAATQGVTIKSMSDLRKAFTDEQWRNIIMHYLKIPLDRAASTEDRESQIDKANDAIGGKSNPLSPTSWYSQALNYDVRFPTAPASWEEIYNFLKPHANTKVQLKAVPQATPLATSRKETLADISAWVPTGAVEFTKWQGGAFDYIKKWLEVLVEQKRSGKWAEVYKTVGAGGTNKVRRARDTIVQSLGDQLEKEGKLLKKDIDIGLFSALRTMDTIVSNYLLAQNN
jgi:hypothetical protein